MTSSWNAFVCLSQHRSYAAPNKMLFARAYSAFCGSGRLAAPLSRVLSHLSPAAQNFFCCHRSIHLVPHILLARLFNCQGTRKFCLPYIPRHKKYGLFQENKKFSKIFFNKKRPLRLISQRSKKLLSLITYFVL